MRFRKILFPTDFSHPCLQIAPCVAAMTEVMQASLVLLHCAEFPRSIPAQAGSEWPDFEKLTAQEHDLLISFAEEHFSAIHPELVHATDDPAEAIARCVDERQIDLVMMPTHGYGAFRRALLGSVTAKVLHDVPCAVWTASHQTAAPNVELKSILCGIEDPGASGNFLGDVAGLAGTFGAALSIVHVYPDFIGTPEERYERPLSPHLEADIRAKLDAIQIANGAKAQVIIVRGEVNEVIAETARRCGADLLVVGRGRAQAFLGGIRSHLYFIIRSSPCPVLALPSLGPQTPGPPHA